MANRKRPCKGQAPTTGHACQKEAMAGKDYCHYHDPDTFEARRCSSYNKDGERCKKVKQPGIEVCEFHAGRVPISVRTARARLAGMVPRALQALEDAMEHGEWQVVVRAAQIILDRAGFGANSTVTVEEKERDLTQLTEEELEARARKVYAALKEAKEQAQYDLEHPNPLWGEQGQGDEDAVS